MIAVGTTIHHRPKGDVLFTCVHPRHIKCAELLSIVSKDVYNE